MNGRPRLQYNSRFRRTMILNPNIILNWWLNGWRGFSFSDFRFIKLNQIEFIHIRQTKRHGIPHSNLHFFLQSLHSHFVVVSFSCHSSTVDRETRIISMIIINKAWDETWNKLKWKREEKICRQSLWVKNEMYTRYDAIFWWLFVDAVLSVFMCFDHIQIVLICMSQV